MKRSSKKTMKRCARVFLNELNQGKAEELRAFLYLCHDVTQYFVDVFWARGDMTASFADLETVHLAVNRFGITTRQQIKEELAREIKKIDLSEVKQLLLKTSKGSKITSGERFPASSIDGCLIGNMLMPLICSNGVAK